jgi:arabinose 5-phosphate isomerase
MRRDDDVPRVDLDTRVMDAMLELSRTGLGLVAVCDAQNRVQGVFTDGDLRRWLVGGGTLNDAVAQAMTRNGVTLQAESRAVEAKERLMKHKISAAPVVDENGLLVGAINLQNFYQAGIL